MFSRWRIVRDVVRTAAVVVGGSSLCYLVCPKDVYDLEFDIADNFVMPWLRLWDPEVAHDISLALAASIISPKDLHEDEPVLNTSLWGLHFSSPIGLAAGYDKDGKAIKGLLGLGFSFVEIGSVTPQPQPGNPKPRLFRLSEDEAVINRYGFNSAGMDYVAKKLFQFSDSREAGIVGVNVGKNKETLDEDAHKDFVAVIDRLGSAADYIVVNLSSPNTPGLRNLQRKDSMRRVLESCAKARDRAHLAKIGIRNRKVEEESFSRPLTFFELPAKAPSPKIPSRTPLLVKISPDLSKDEMHDIAELILDMKGTVDGLIVSNTTISRPSSLRSSHAIEAGGLSGRPLRDISTAVIANMYDLTSGQVPIIGVGGISDGKDAFEKICAGASLVQVYTMLVYRGPGTAKRIKRELKQILNDNGFSSVSEAVGSRSSLMVHKSMVPEVNDEPGNSE